MLQKANRKIKIELGSRPEVAVNSPPQPVAALSQKISNPLAEAELSETNLMKSEFEKETIRGWIRFPQNLPTKGEVTMAPFLTSR